MNDNSPSRQLSAAPQQFDFFQAVRLLERLAHARDEQNAHNAHARRFPVGEDHHPAREVVRFRALAAQGFPPASISRLDDTARVDEDHEKETAAQPQMTVSFLGLTGPNGVMPQHYTTLLIERIRDKDYALRDFLDMFNHRGISLFYRAWEKYRFAFGYERVEHKRIEHERTAAPKSKSKSKSKSKTEDLFTGCLYSLLGLGTQATRGRMLFDDEALLFYAGHFARRHRPAVSLEQILADYFELPAEIRQFQGQWLRLDEPDQSSLPTPQYPQGLNCELGTTAVAGERVWNVEARFRVRLGPLDYERFRRFTPSGDALQPLGQLVRTYVGPHLDFDVQPVLRQDEVPWCKLGGPESDASCLGWNTWIRSSSFDHDVDDAVFET